MRCVFLGCAAMIAFSGCAALEDYHYCFVNHRRADSAWKDCYSRQERRDFSSDYEDGWKQGYFDVSTGSNGEPPSVPPNKYWSPRYQSPEGQLAIEDWFAGYQDGATDAERNGSGAFHWITTGPNVPTEPMHWISEDHSSNELIDAAPADGMTRDSQHFLQPFQPVTTWPTFPQTETVLMPEEPKYLDTSSVVADTATEELPNQESVSPQEVAPPPQDPVEEAYPVPPVVTEE